MPDLFCILNHELTEKQIKEAYLKLGVNSIFYAPEDINNIWKNIHPEGELDIESLNEALDWIKKDAVKDDYVLVQGEFGATCYIVDFCFKYGLIPIYATSKRYYEEMVLADGSIERKHVFNHVQFRKYIRYMED